MFKEEQLGHLLFVDDLLIFGKASLGEASCIKSYLDKYCSWFGQSINALKSSIRFNKNTHISTSILNILPYNPNSSSFIYLGLPILLGHSKRVAFQNIIDKVQSKVEGWRSKTLSQASRLVLINSFAAAIPTYAMSSFLLPTSICSKFDQIFKNFQWGYPSSKTRNLSLKSWDSLCLPKEQGGLGFRKMKDVKLALISKLGWKLHSNLDSMWVAQLRGKYLSSGSFFSLSLPPPPNSGSSWLWKGILSSQSVIALGICHRIHLLSPLSVQNSAWVPTLPNFTPSPAHNIYFLPNLIVSDLILPNCTWNLPFLLSLFDTQSFREIQKIIINPSPSSGFLQTPSSNGLFSSSSTYHLISSPRISANSSPLEPKFWKLNLNARLKLFLWKIA